MNNTDDTAVRGHNLYIYGGILEVGDREITLDDCWTIDMHRRDKWICIWSGTMQKQVWKGFESDDESNLSTDRETNMRSDEDEDDVDLNTCTIVEDDYGASSLDRDMEDRRAAKKVLKKAAKIE